METRKITQALNLVCTRAPSFPEGIMTAFEELNSIFPERMKNSCFGLYEEAEDGQVVYRAGLEGGEEDVLKSGKLELVRIEPGTFLVKPVSNWAEQVHCIGQSFDQMLKQDGTDKSAMTIEKYDGSGDMECWVRMRT